MMRQLDPTSCAPKSLKLRMQRIQMAENTAEVEASDDVQIDDST